MITFQHIKSGRYLASRSDWSHAVLLADAYPFHVNDEAPMRARYADLVGYRTVAYSTRIDHPENDLGKLSPEELQKRYPV